ncbi:MAG: RNA methyltransferase substrate-binding domain-containing protein, partial [Crocinitomicaceae bacterium]
MEEKRDRYPRKEKKDVIFGVHPVIEAIKSGQELNKILIQKGIDK